VVNVVITAPLQRRRLVRPRGRHSSSDDRDPAVRRTGWRAALPRPARRKKRLDLAILTTDLQASAT
jgi:hypothetical protein